MSEGNTFGREPPVAWVAAPAYDIDVTIAEQIELSDLNYAAALRELARRTGGIVHDEGGVMLYAALHPLPVLSNGVMRTDPAVAATEVLARAREFFARQQRGYSVLVGAHISLRGPAGW